MGRRFDAIDIVLISLIGAYLFILAILGLVFLLKLVDKHEEKKLKNTSRIPQPQKEQKSIKENQTTIKPQITTFTPKEETKPKPEASTQVENLPKKEITTSKIDPKLLPHTHKNESKIAAPPKKKMETTKKKNNQSTTNTKKKTTKPVAKKASNNGKNTNKKPASTPKKNNTSNRSNGYVSPTKRKKKKNAKRK